MDTIYNIYVDYIVCLISDSCMQSHSEVASVLDVASRLPNE